MSVLINASTSSGLVQTADTSGTVEIQSNGTTRLTVASTGAYGQLVSGTAVTLTTQTSVDFTSIPSWVKRITVMFNGVSTNGTSNIQIQIGAGSVDTASYSSAVVQLAGGAATIGTAATSGFLATASNSAVSAYNGNIVINLLSSNAWVQNGTLYNTAGVINTGAASKTLSSTLDRVRITTVNGTDTFDAGTINVMYEG
jgi:hypothetical protein